MLTFANRVIQNAGECAAVANVACIDVNCVDSLGRGAINLAIENENLEMVELLIVMGVRPRDALLHAINAEFVEAVELLLEYEELIYVEDEKYVSRQYPLLVRSSQVISLVYRLYYTFLVSRISYLVGGTRRVGRKSIGVRLFSRPTSLR